MGVSQKTQQKTQFAFLAFSFFMDFLGQKAIFPYRPFFFAFYQLFCVFSAFASYYLFWFGAFYYSFIFLG